MNLPTIRAIEHFQEALLAWYVTHGRTFPWRYKSRSSYELIVSEILLKRTRAETVSVFFPAFIRKYSSWRKLAAATEAQLEHTLRPIGLSKQRAASLAQLASQMVKLNGRFPTKRQSVEGLPGVGQYVTNAIMLFCHDGREPLLDVNMARVLERCFGRRTLVDIRYDPWLQELAKRVVNHSLSIEMNWAILDLAATVCRQRMPQCQQCPVNRSCKSASSTNPAPALSPIEPRKPGNR